MPQTLMLATDLGHRSDRALDRAAALARAWQARLLIVHALKAASLRDDAPSWRRVTDPLALARRRIHRDLGATADLALEVIVERGDPGAVVAELAARHQADLVISGVARDETLGRLLLGSTVETLVKQLQAPLLVVKRRPHGDYRHLVVATDLTPDSKTAGDAALAW
ncbi:MAG: universal stress protein, partial [Gammaproteobacteria bacterium]